MAARLSRRAAAAYTLAEIKHWLGVFLGRFFGFCSSSVPPCPTGRRWRQEDRCRRAATGVRPRTATHVSGWKSCSRTCRKPDASRKRQAPTDVFWRMIEPLPHGLLPDSTAHLCVDMQNLFAEATPWQTPWMARTRPVTERLARHRPERNIFTRFIPPTRARSGVADVDDGRLRVVGGAGLGRHRGLLDAGHCGGAVATAASCRAGAAPAQLGPSRPQRGRTQPSIWSLTSPIACMKA